ncbi:hypothetical protein [Streptomyces sp. Wh19]|uniref:Uncharacterized protein n=1 Tax=Streptomyces sanglieri TaxID=193460 RepID=A0ABW2WSW6_9ACTN|nr:hypothetical protein [Streptomyces sp. Wh19]MDV9193832.1 hypothetical protein [Streptomyces sp. Wh19]
MTVWEQPGRHWIRDRFSYYPVIPDYPIRVRRDFIEESGLFGLRLPLGVITITVFTESRRKNGVAGEGKGDYSVIPYFRQLQAEEPCRPGPS